MGNADLTTYSKPIFYSDLHVDSTTLLKEAKSIALRLLNSSATVVPGNRAVKLGPIDVRRAIAHVTPSDSLGLIFRNTLLDACGHAEVYGAGSGIITLLAGIELCDLYNKGNNHSINLKDISYAFRVGSEDCFEIISSISKDEKSVEICRSACTLAGTTSNIKINRDAYKSSAVEFKSGFNFPIGIVPEFCIMTGKKQWSCFDSDIILIDGIIESVGEIHHILEHYSLKKEKCLLVARGFSEEVIATIATNFNRGTIEIVPSIAKGDLEGINILGDLGIACCSSVVSSLKGELISSIDVSTLSKVDHISINTGHLRINNPSSALSVKAQISHIKELRNATEIDDKIELYNKRISSLSSNNIQINLGKDIADDIGIVCDRVDVCIRMFNEIATFGVLDINDLLLHTNDIVISRVCKRLLDGNINRVPVRCMHAGLAAADTIRAALTSKVFIVKDDAV